MSHWRLSRRLVTVTLTGFLTIAALVTIVVGSGPYGRRVVEAEDITTYPEAGPDGNYRSFDQLPFKLFGYEWMTYFIGPMYSHGDPIVSWFNVHKKLDQMTLLFVANDDGAHCPHRHRARDKFGVAEEDRGGRGIR